MFEFSILKVEYLLVMTEFSTWTTVWSGKMRSRSSEGLSMIILKITEVINNENSDPGFQIFNE